MKLLILNRYDTYQGPGVGMYHDIVTTYFIDVLRQLYLDKGQ